MKSEYCQFSSRHHKSTQKNCREPQASAEVTQTGRKGASAFQARLDLEHAKGLEQALDIEVLKGRQLNLKLVWSMPLWVKQHRLSPMPAAAVGKQSGYLEAGSGLRRGQPGRRRVGGQGQAIRAEYLGARKSPPRENPYDFYAHTHTHTHTRTLTHTPEGRRACVRRGPLRRCSAASGTRNWERLSVA